MARLILDSATYIFECSHEEREIARNAGMRWSKEARHWFTVDLAVAVRLREYATGAAKIKLERLLIRYSPWPMPLPPSPKGLQLKDFQKRAVRFALERNSCYLRLDPGLGKTPISATIAKALTGKKVFVTPPFLTRNVEAEFNRWAPKLTTAIYGYDFDPFKADVLILPDSQISVDARTAINADPGYRTLFVDEAHRFKSEDAQRTQALFGNYKSRGLAPHFSRKIFLSGTPMPNRPMELFPVLSHCAPETIDFMNREEFGVEYCAGGRDQFGHWDFSGASNVKKLAERVIAPSGPFMLKMKKDILNLPPKIEEVFTLAPSPRVAKELARAEAELPAEFGLDPDAALQHYLKSQGGLHAESDLYMATYLRLLGELKAPLVAEYINALLEETSEKILLFAHHKTTLDALGSHLSRWNPLVILSSTPTEGRQARVDAFQSDASKRLLIGGITTMGLGYTLTAADRVFIAEPSWVNAVNDQASDRAHRYGRKKTVLVQFGVFPNSLDGKIIAKLVRKREVTKHL